MKRIAVYCGSSLGSKPIYNQSALELGNTLANHNIELVYGGANVGLMGAVANGVLDGGGKVIGVLPYFLASKELEHKSITELILVDNMHERKAKMSKLADGFIALPGGFGTMEELFEMLTWAQLALHNKPIALLNIDGYYDALLVFIETMIDGGFLKSEYRDLILVSDDMQDLLKQMLNYVAPINDKWHIVK